MDQRDSIALIQTQIRVREKWGTSYPALSVRGAPAEEAEGCEPSPSEAKGRRRRRERESSGAVSVAVGLFMLAMGETWTCRRDTSVTWHNHYYWGIIIDAVHMSELLLLGGCSGSARAKISFWPSVT